MRAVDAEALSLILFLMLLYCFVVAVLGFCFQFCVSSPSFSSAALGQPAMIPTGAQLFWREEQFKNVCPSHHFDLSV